MVVELGENSYLAAAFTGAFELAEQNINDDAGYTAQYYIERAGRAIEIENRAKEEITRLKAELEGVRKAHQGTSKVLDKTSERAQKYAYVIDDLKDSLKTANLVVITLKARLYDYLVREQAGA